MTKNAETTLTPLLRVRKQASEEAKTEVLQKPSVAALKPSNGRECVLEIEGGKDVFYRGAYVTSIPLRGNDIIVGRRDVMAGQYPDVDLAKYRKDDPCLSRRHLRIYRDYENTWYVEDLCNHNSTFYNDLRTPLNHERHELKNGDRILVSMSVVMVFRTI